MKGSLTLTPCAAPPVAKHQPGQWWRYEVATSRNSASGYAPGTKANAEKIAKAALQALQRMEGKPVRVSETTTKHIGHNPGACNCRMCANQRYKERTFGAVMAKKKRARKQAA